MAALLGALAGAVPRAQETNAAAPAAPPPSAATWQDAPGYLALFVPRLYRESYRTFVSRLPLDAALRAIASDPSLLHPPAAWTPHAENAVDAFGTGGTYDRWKLARLYGSRRPLVARGPRGRGLVEESWTLVSPYPAADLSRLEPGTLLIVLRVP